MSATRDPNVLAFERTFAGVTVKKVSFSATGFDFECEASGETLVSVGLISPAMLRRMEGTSSQICFGPRPNREDNYCPFYTQLRYRSAHGRPTAVLAMRRWTPDARPQDVVEFCRTIGVRPPTQSEIDAEIAEQAARQKELIASLAQFREAEDKPKRQIEREGNVIQFPVNGTGTAFMRGLMHERVAIYVPVDAPIEQLAHALASVGLHMKSMQGKLVAHRAALEAQS